MSRAVLRAMMKARHGRIINIPLDRQHGQRGTANYAASRLASSVSANRLAREIGSRNITVNCIAQPGFIGYPT